MKNKVSEKQPTSGAELVKVIKEVWVKEISKEYCQSLIDSLPRRIEAVIKNKGGHTTVNIENPNIFYVNICVECVILCPMCLWLIMYKIKQYPKRK